MATFDVRRFNAIRRHQVQIGRGSGNCLELREAAPPCTFEPEAAGPDEQNARTIYRRARSNPAGGCATNPEGKPASTNSAQTKPT